MDIAKRSTTSSRKTSSTKTATKTVRPSTTATVAAPRTPRRVTAPRAQPTTEQIATRAYLIFEARGGEPGDPMADWLQAERELCTPPAKRAPRTKSA